MPEFRKRDSGIDAERKTLDLLIEAADRPEVDESACIEVAYAIERWHRLTFSERRAQLEFFGVRQWHEMDGRGRHAQARDVKLEVGSFTNAVL